MCMGEGGVDDVWGGGKGRVRVKLGEGGRRGEEEVGSRPVPCLNVSLSPGGLQVQTGCTVK